MENEYSLLGSARARLPAMPAPQTDAMERLCSVPSNWTIEHDENLAQFLCCHLEVQNDQLGSIKDYVESIDVSSFSVSIY